MSRPSLATRARAVLDEAGVASGARVLVACSGGSDSQVLLDVLAHVAKGGRIALAACGVDHGLRSEAAEELALAAALAEARGVPFRSVRLAVEKGSNLQARARAARWDALLSVADQLACPFVATAHHLDDRAETVLLRILRGAPLAGLAVLPPREGRRLRPLVRCRKAELVRHAERRGLASARDPSNEDPRFVRVQIRTEVLPLLSRLDPRVVEHLGALADRAGDGRDRDEARLFADVRRETGVSPSARAIAQLLSGDEVLLPGGRAALLPEPLGRVVIREQNAADPARPTASRKASQGFAEPRSRARS
ncbi:MAG: tRNA lysidine(34) synthetase TilS [Myxococcales bacterium]|nr:tRNA lysidine(34) synthetase TilS [Myxococcales bacterium]